MKIKFDWFLVGLGLAIALAWVFPGPGSDDGWMHPHLLNKAGVALIFFLHGATLSFNALKAGTLQWPLHLVVQLCTFLVFPLIGLAALFLGGGLLPASLHVGIFFLCALPSTVSSSVAMTAIARGNVAGAVFNATLSSLIGIFITPIWIAAVLHASGESVPLGPVVLDLVIWLLLPLAFGQVCRPWIATSLHRHKHLVHLVDRGVILILVYTSFCDSVTSGVWKGQGLDLLAITLGTNAALFFIILLITNSLARACKFSEEDRIAAVFCGSKKSLAAGIPMAQIIFAGNPGLSLIVLPLIMYHALQLVLCSWLARRWSERPDPAHAARG